MKVKVNCCIPMKVKVNFYNPKSLMGKMNGLLFCCAKTEKARLQLFL